MRLTSFSDYALRVLMYAAAHDGRLITVEETARVYGISRTHLTKVVNRLTQTGYLTAVRGKTGGVTLARPANKIMLGAVMRVTEPDYALVECLSPENHCRITSRCRLRGALQEAMKSFWKTFDGYTLADILLDPEDFGNKPAA